MLILSLNKGRVGGKEVSMHRAIRKSHPVLKIVNGSLIDLPAPMNLSV